MRSNNGKQLESLIGIIQETLKDSDNTTIYKNKKIQNTSGRYREFDLVIESVINKLFIRIVIECKDYKTPISVEKLEAFQGKCARIPSINKKVFVSTFGYQADAINAGEEFGIELYQLADIDSAIVLEWFPVKQLGLRFQLFSFELMVDTDQLSVESLNTYKGELYLSFQGSVYDLNEFVNQSIIEGKRGLWSRNLFEFIKNGPEKQLNHRIRLPFKVSLNDTFVVNNEGLSVCTREINGLVDCWLVEKSPDIISAKSFANSDEAQAGYLAIKAPGSSKMEIVVTPENRKIFYTDDNGIRIEMKTLGRYDRETNTYTRTHDD